MIPISDIKLRETQRDIKLFDRKGNSMAHLKDATLKGKEALEEKSSGEDPSADAIDQIERAATSFTYMRIPHGEGNKNIKTGSPLVNPRNTSLKIEEILEETGEGSNSSARDPSAQAANRIEGSAIRLGYVAGVYKPHKKAAKNIKKGRDNFKKAYSNLPKERQRIAEEAKATASEAQGKALFLDKKAKEARSKALYEKDRAVNAKQNLQQTRLAGRQNIKEAKGIGRATDPTSKSKNIKEVNRTVKSGGKNAVAVAKREAKTANMTAKTAAKAASNSAKAAHQAAKASEKAAKKALQTSKAAAKTAVKTAKAAKRTVVAVIKAMIAATKGLIAFIMAGGWILFLIVIIIAMIGMLLASPLGIFFSGEDGNNDVPNAILEINQEYKDRISTIKSTTPHDQFEMSGFPADWKDVLAVYAVKVALDGENPDEVVTMDDRKKEILRSVFWDMTTITQKVDVHNEEKIGFMDNGNGELIQVTETIQIKTLVITVTCKNAEEMAVEYGFTGEQKALMDELFSPEMAYLWNDILESIVLSYGEFDGEVSLLGIPLFLQYSAPWGGVPFGGGNIGSSGCSVTCLAMTLSYLKQQVILPDAIAGYVGNRHYVAPSGQSWGIFPDVAGHWGVSCTYLGLNADRIAQALRSGSPVIVSMGPGTFTRAGHFIVLSGITESGKIKVNDPNDNSAKNHKDKEFDLSLILREGKSAWQFD